MNSKTTIYRLYCGLFFLGWLNFMVFWFASLALGGDAVNGKVEAGHYYLSSHGRVTEVSATVFNYSRWHTYSVFVTHPLGMLAGFLAFRMKRDKDAKATWSSPQRK